MLVRPLIFIMFGYDAFVASGTLGEVGFRLCVLRPCPLRHLRWRPDCAAHPTGGNGVA